VCQRTACPKVPINPFNPFNPFNPINPSHRFSILIAACA